MANYDEASAVSALRKKRSVKISNGVIKVSCDNTELGNSSWGKISYLVNYCGYKQIFVDEDFNNSSKFNDDDKITKHKPKAKERLSLAKLSKKIMK